MLRISAAQILPDQRYYKLCRKKLTVIKKGIRPSLHFLLALSKIQCKPSDALDTGSFTFLLL